ncbi:Cyclin-related protein, partial [Stegodyphus mimosarum]
MAIPDGDIDIISAFKKVSLEEQHVSWPLSDCTIHSALGKHNTQDLINLILEGGLKLKCISPVISKAMLFAHILQRSKEAAKYDPAMLAAATLTLSSASYDEDIDKTMVVLTFHHMMKKEYLLDLLGETKFNLDKYLKETELMLFRMLDGITSHKIAHEYVPFFSQNLIPLTEVSSVWQPFITTVWKIISDFYMSELCLDFKACDIAVVANHVALMVCKVKSYLPSDWYQDFSPGLTMETKNRLSRVMINICSQN